MKDNTIVFIKTHLINKQIINEYLKISQYKYPTYLFIDNRNNILNNSGLYCIHNIYQNDIKCITTNIKTFDNLNLPHYVMSGFDTDYGRVLWYNIDYPLYIMRKLFPNIEYFWQFEYDVYYNSTDYIAFFENLDKNENELIMTGLRQCNNNWVWGKNVDWIYKDIHKYSTFGPILRISKKAIDFLYKKRLEQKGIFDSLLEEYGPQDDRWWTHCELFIGTELMNNGFNCINLHAPEVIYHPKEHEKFYKEKRYLNYDNKLYHPVKDPSFIEEIKTCL